MDNFVMRPIVHQNFAHMIALQFYLQGLFIRRLVPVICFLFLFLFESLYFLFQEELHLLIVATILLLRVL